MFVVHQVEALTNEFKLLPLLLPGLESTEFIAVLQLHLRPKSLNPVELGMIGNIKDQTDLVHPTELFGHDARVDRAVVHKDMPVLPRPL